MENAALLRNLKTIGVTLDGDFVAAVRTIAGAEYDEVYFKVSRTDRIESAWAADPAGNVQQVNLADVAAVAPCPFRVPDAIARPAWKKGESGMGYYRITVILSDGTAFRDMITTRPYIVHLPPGRSVAEVVRIDHEGFH